MSIYKKFSKNSPHLFIFALVLGAALAVGLSVWATSVGTDVSVSGNLDAAGTLTLTGRSTLSGGILVNNATSTITSLVMVNATSTEATTTYFAITGGLMANNASSTIVNLTIFNASTTNATTTYLNIGTGGLLTSAASSTIGNLTMVNSTTTNATTTNLAVTSNATTSTLVVGGSGTRITSILHGFCEFGPIAGSQSIAATTTGTVACTTQTPTGLAAGDKVWLTASTTGNTGITTGTLYDYTGIASSTSATRIQAIIRNISGAAYTVTTSTWQYLIVK